MKEDYKYCDVTTCRKTGKTTMVYYLHDGTTVTKYDNRG